MTDRTEQPGISRLRTVTQMKGHDTIKEDVG